MKSADGMKEPIHFYLSELNFKTYSGSKCIERKPRKQQTRFAESSAGKPRGVLTRGKALLTEFLECSSIHGLNQIAKKGLHWSEYFTWFFVLVASISWTAYLGHKAWKRFQYNPTVISIEKDYKNWNTTFAMATVCPKTKVDSVKLRNIAGRFKVRNVEGFVNFFTALAHSSYEDFGSLPDYDEISPRDYLQILTQAKYNFSFELSNSQGFKQDLLLMVTENGLCYTFNTDVGIYFTPWNLNGNLRVRRGNSLLLHGSPLDGEVFTQIMKMSSGYNVSLTGPYDVADLGVRRITSEIQFYLLLDISALSIISSEGMRSLSMQQRRCRFFDESDLEVSNVYSYSLCRMQCRADLAYKLCRCIPYFYRRSERRPYCNAKGMKCLGRYGRFLSELREPSNEEKIRCPCLPLCNDVHFLIEFETILQWTRATNLKFRMAHYPRIRLKRDIIFGFTDLLVSIGGMAGLFLGCSVLSFVEIIYFVTIRLAFYVVQHVRDLRRTSKGYPNLTAMRNKRNEGLICVLPYKLDVGRKF